MRKPLILLTIAMSSNAFAQYKCVDQSGRTSFQQTPCPSNQRSTKLELKTSPTAPPQNAASQATNTKNQTVEQRMVAKYQHERHVKEIEDRIAGVENQIFRRNAQMESELQQLRSRKALANNNLAGATLEQSLSTEMQAVVARTAANNESDYAQLKQLREELDRAKKQVK